jgi:4a-hydroxytetrahydrobiopterin dehydratase
VATLSAQEIHQHLKDVPRWTLVDDRALRRQFTFGSFPEAISFVVRVAFHAEAADHHPDITINYRHVSLTYTTHSEGGLTVKDFDGARAVDRIAWV